MPFWFDIFHPEIYFPKTNALVATQATPGDPHGIRNLWLALAQNHTAHPSIQSDPCCGALICFSSTFLVLKIYL